MSLFIELYLDEDVDVLITDLLKAYGFSALTTRDADQIQNSDADQLAYAAMQQKALLTHNRVHFEVLAKSYFEKNKTHWGIIIAVRRSSYEIVQRLLSILNQVTADDMKNQIRYI